MAAAAPVAPASSAEPGTLWQPAMASRLRPLLPVLPWAFCAALTLAVYGSSLHAGIMFDAALDLPRAVERTWLDILTNAGPSPYYRPVTLLLWKAAYTILGHNDFVVLHGLSLLSHIVCGWLVYQLGRRLLDVPAAITAAALFLWFPLNYQVVAFIDSLFHSLAAGWILAACVLYWDAASRGSGRRLAAALVCGALALFTHEGAALLLPSGIIGIELLLRRRGVARRWTAFAFAGESLAFFAVWSAIPRWPSTPKLDLPSLKLNADYFLQAIAYPLTQTLGKLPRLQGREAAEVALVSAAVLAGLLWLASRRSRLMVACLALIWFGAAELLPAVLLPWPNYVIDAPRLVYAGSAGIALLWAAVLSPRRVSLAGVFGVVAAIAILVQSALFLQLREGLLDQGARLVDQLVSTAVRSDAQAGRLYVNVPAFLGPKGDDFLLGHSGITMLPDYFGLDLEVAAATGIRVPIESLAFDDLARPWEAAYGFQGRHANAPEMAAAVARGGGVYVTEFSPGRLQLKYAGGLLDRATNAAPTRFGSWLVLDAASVSRASEAIDVHLTWRTTAPAPGDYTVFVHIVGDGSQPVAQSDGYPVAGLLPFKDWPQLASVQDERRIPLPAQAAGKPLRVLVGLYDRASPTTRAVAVDAGGARLQDDALAISANP